MSSGPIKCPNCDREYPAEYSYCPYCGQKKGDKLTLGILFSNIISNYFSVDGRFFKSIGPLLFKPGFLPNKFVGGKRKTYLHPARMYLFVSIVFFFVFSFFIRASSAKIDQTVDRDIISQVEADTSSIIKEELDSLVKEFPAVGFIQNSHEIDSLITVGADVEKIYGAMGMRDDAGYFTRKIYSQLLKLYREGGAEEIYQRFFDSLPIAMFFLLPVFALILWAFYSRKGPYVNHLVFSFYYFAFVFVVVGIVYVFNYWLYGLPDILDLVLGLVPLVYLVWGLKRFYRQSWKWTVFKGMSTVFLFLLFIVPIAGGLVALYAFLYF